jgi:hypothetical protein
MVRSASQFIGAKGVQTVAAATGRTPGAIRVWKHRNRFPREAWLELSQAFPELTLSELKRLEAKAAKVRAAHQ